jgi:hypothetical protein
MVAFWLRRASDTSLRSQAAVTVKQLVGSVQRQFGLRSFPTGGAFALRSHPLSPGSKFEGVHSEARFFREPRMMNSPAEARAGGVVRAKGERYATFSFGSR